MREKHIFKLNNIPVYMYKLYGMQIRIETNGSTEFICDGSTEFIWESEY